MTQVIDTPAAESGPVAIEPRILERREEVSRQRVRKRLRVAGIVGAVVVVLAGAWATLHSSVLAARHVAVIGAIHTGVGPVEAAVGLTGQPLVDVNPGLVAARVEALPWVAHATVTRHWPDGITVTVVERVPAAVVVSGHGAVLVDRTGHVLGPAPVASPGTPVLTAPVTPGPAGSVLGAGADPGLSVLAAVPPLLTRRVEQVSVAADGDVTLALTGNVGVTFGPAVELAAKFDSLLSVLVDVPPTVPEVIDVTVPDAPAVGPPTPPVSTVKKVPSPTSEAPSGQSSHAPQMRRTR